MRTYMAKATDIKRNWYIIDAEGKPLGRVAAQAAAILRGKHLPTYTPHVDCGDHVIVINAAKAVVTGKKMTDKMYYHHTGWIGNLKESSYGAMLEKHPTRPMTLAIKGMIPKNSLGAKALTRLRVYAGAEHEHQAQNPVVWER
ncbi:MAG: 50S ribosomal protein L13 [Clostridia bacterium]|nr:50S ribosomal protein L13 [Clostridia bacterium]